MEEDPSSTGEKAITHIRASGKPDWFQVQKTFVYFEQKYVIRIIDLVAD